MATTKRLMLGMVVALVLAAPAVKAADTPPMPDVAYDWCYGWFYYTDPICWLI
jgi:hypothetical protein